MHRLDRPSAARRDLLVRWAGRLLVPIGRSESGADALFGAVPRRCCDESEPRAGSRAEPQPNRVQRRYESFMAIDSLSIATLPPVTQLRSSPPPLPTATHALAMHRIRRSPLRRTPIHGSVCTSVVPSSVRVDDGRQRPLAVRPTRDAVANRLVCLSLGMPISSESSRQAHSRADTINHTNLRQLLSHARRLLT